MTDKESAPPSPKPLDLFELPNGGIIRVAHDAIVMIDEAQLVVAMNSAAQAMFRCTAEEALGQPLERWIPAVHRGEHREHVRRMMAAGVSERPMADARRIGALRNDGEPFVAEVALSRVNLAGAGGVQRHYAALLHDVSAEDALRRDLEAVQRRMRAVFEAAPIAIWIVEGERLSFANRAAARLFGTGPAQALIGRSIYTLVSDDSHAELRQRIEGVLAGRADSATARGRLVQGDGATREVEIALAALPDHGRGTVQMMVADITRQRQEAQALEQSRESLRRLSANVVEAREEERRRIARELHDDLGQRLTALKLGLAELAATCTDGKAHPQLESMGSLLDSTVGSLRRIAADLRPLMLDDLGLNAAVEWLCRDAAQRLGLEVTVQLGDADPTSDERLTIAFYRMVQEALTNVARHAHATEAQVALLREGAHIVLTVADNGVGYPARALSREGSYGLLGMQERAQGLGGSIDIDNPAGGGARLTVRVPLQRP